MNKKLNFEESLKRLEEITQSLEDGDLSLDDSLKIFEEGVRLSRFCEKKLTDVEQKLEILKTTDIPDDFQFDDPADEITDESTQLSEKKEPKTLKKAKTKETLHDNDENLLF